MRDLLYPPWGSQLEAIQQIDHPKSHKRSGKNKISYNMLPGLVIFLLGKSMSGHHQASALSVALHTQVRWISIMGFCYLTNDRIVGSAYFICRIGQGCDIYFVIYLPTTLCNSFTATDRDRDILLPHGRRFDFHAKCGL